MVLLAVWPLIRWTPSMGKTYPPDITSLRTEEGVVRGALALAALGVAVGAVDGIFDARMPQDLFACVSVGQHCTDVLTTPAVIWRVGTICVHAAIFLAGSTAAYFIWLGVAPTLLMVWD